MPTIISAKNKNFLLDVTSNRITFLDNRFYLGDDGKYYPSATTILDAYPKGASFYEWLKKNGEDSDEIRDEAGRRGSRVHELTEKYDNGEEVSLLNENGDIAMKMSEWAMLERYVEFRTKHHVEIIDTEQNLVSEKLGYGGTRDRIITYNGKRLLMDIKTGNAIYNHFWLQLTSYLQLEAENSPLPFDGIAVLWLNAKTKTDGKGGSCQGKGWQLIIQSDQKEIDRYWALFQATHRLWLAENGSMQPKNTMYSLKHKI
jgi:hypothetical protein